MFVWSNRNNPAKMNTPFTAELINKGTYILVAIERPMDQHYTETFLTFGQSFTIEKEAAKFAASKMVQRMVKIANTAKP